ncbi:hypothetical protein KIN20_011771 [Parelaphostrongylus tenuis]|uniref:Uncharacterized protein n=1 Tax=Parelaphostrongylus tenuis TaxID=148309 RepID=A0AAD5MVX7_PARTN|nr:hypothetical protein KIN20_007984 [Parelaphostrongylus tenuis]KAJ1354754.1 hypothetical protein KIN20_011771 [Parelaphostrongylus tenuis]
MLQVKDNENCAVPATLTATSQLITTALKHQNVQGDPTLIPTPEVRSVPERCLAERVSSSKRHPSDGSNINSSRPSNNSDNSNNARAAHLFRFRPTLMMGGRELVKHRGMFSHA